METATTFLPLESALSVIGETGVSPRSFYFPLLSLFFLSILVFVLSLCFPPLPFIHLFLISFFPVSGLRSSWRYEHCCLVGHDALKSGKSLSTFRRTCCFHLHDRNEEWTKEERRGSTLKIKPTRSSETSINFYKFTRLHVSDESNLPFWFVC